MPRTIKDPFTPATPPPAATTVSPVLKKLLQQAGITPEEMQRKAALIAKLRVDGGRYADPGRVTGGQSSKDYVWLNQDDTYRAKMEGSGYTVCKDPSVSSYFQTSDGTHRRGDLILYEVEKDTREARKLDAELRSLESVQARRGEQQFQAFAEQHGQQAQIDKED